MCVGTGNLQHAIELKNNLGLDAVSAYALPSGDMTLSGAPFSDQISTAKEFWAGAAEAKQPLVPPVPTGWDPRPRATAHAKFGVPVWVDEGPKHFQGPTGEELTTLFQDAHTLVKQQTIAGGGPGVAIVYAWNENTEGGWLLPTLGNGTARLDAIRNVLKQPR